MSATDPEAAASIVPIDDRLLLDRIRQGDEAAFTTLVRRHSASLLRLVKSPTLAHSAEEIVQETWLEMLRSIERFEGRSSVKTWLCGIVINLARARARKEQRSIPLSALGDAQEAAVEADRFLPPEHHWAGHWAQPPTAGFANPERDALNKELRALLNQAIDALPDPQREIVILRDIEGLSGEEVCNILELRDTHQRVLLHRARSRLRSALERYFEGHS